LRLKQLIRDSRQAIGWDAPWFVAQVSYHNPEMRVTAGELGSSKNALEVRDLWTRQTRSITDGVISARVEGHGVAMLRTHSSPDPAPRR